MAVRSFNISLSPENGLSGYLRDIREFPMLKHGEEIAHANRWKKNGDIEAAHALVTSHLRLAAKIAMGYKGYGLPVAELISEGNVGLMQSLKRYDPDKGYRFSTYAIWWIRAAIQEYILHSWSLVKIGTTAAQKKLFFNLRRVKDQIKAIQEGDMTPDQVAAVSVKLNVSVQEVVNMDRRLSGPDHSLNVAVREEGEGEWQDWLESNEESCEDELGRREETDNRRVLLSKAMKSLNERELKIFTERRLKDDRSKLEDLAHQHGISRERVRQIEMRAFSKVQKFVKNAALEQRLTM